MAKLTGYPVARKPPSLTGKALVTTWRGIAILKKWPRKRKRPIPPNQQIIVDWFTATNKLFKQLPAESQMWYRQQREGTPLYPRDIYMAHQAGTLFRIILKDGTKRYPVSFRNKVSESLDVFGTQHGSVLFRGEDFWSVLSPGSDGDYLVSRGPDADPEFQAPPTGSGIWKEIGTYSVASGVVDVSGLTLTSYEEIQIRLQTMQFQTTKDNLRIQLYMGGSLVTTGYRYRTNQMASNGNNDNSNSTSASAIFINSSNSGWEVSTTGKGGLSGSIEIADPSGSQNKVLGFRGQTQFDGGNFGVVSSGGELSNSSAITGFKLSGPAQNLAGGRVVLIGRD